MLHGAPSTSFLASIKPKPVIAWTALMTWTLVGPAAFKTKLTSVGPAGAASSAGAAAPATATGAAAVTPNSSSTALTSSFNSTTVISFNEAIISSFVNLAIVISS